MAINYRVSIRKTFGATSGKGTWVNNYDVRCAGVTLIDELDDAVNSIAAFEKLFHQKDVRFVSATCTALDGPNFKKPQGTRVIALGGTGSRQRADVNAETGTYFQDIALYVKFPTANGSTGAKVYRGVCTEELIYWNQGVPIITQTLLTYFQEAKAGMFSNAKPWALVVEQTSKGAHVGWSDCSDAIIQSVKRWKSDRRAPKKTAVNATQKSIAKKAGEAAEILGNITTAIALGASKGNEIVLTAATIKALTSIKNSTLALMPAQNN